MFSNRQIIWATLCVALFSSSLAAQVANDDCITATEITGFTNSQFVCVEGTTKNALPDSNFTSPCNITDFPKVWFRITNTYIGSYFSLQVKGDQKAILMLQFFGSVGGCGAMTPIPLTVNEQFCVLSINGKIELIGKKVDWNTYYLAVTSLTPAGEDFTVCYNSLVKEYACGSEKDLMVFGNPGATVPQRPFITGQSLYVSMIVESFSPIGNSCQWLQGVVPFYGTGWDPQSFSSQGEPWNNTLNGLSTQSLYNGLYDIATWSWFDDVNYHLWHPYIQAGDIDSNGTLDLCHTAYQKDCTDTGGLFGGCCSPCWDPQQGTVLPGGWFAYGINGTCNIPGPPVGFDFGDGNSCTELMGPWAFSYPLTIKPANTFQCDPEETIDEVTLGFFTFTDGEIGSWTGVTEECLNDPPIIETLPVVCVNNGPPPITIPILACTGDTLIIHPIDHVLNPVDIQFWGYYSSQDLMISEGYMPLTDGITMIVNNPDLIYPLKIPLYIYGYSGAQRVSAILSFEIIVYPLPDATFTWTTFGHEVHFKSIQQVDSSFMWSFGDSTTSTEKDPVHTYEQSGIYTVELIISTPCGADTTSQVITIGMLPIASFNLQDTSICIGDTILISSENEMPGDSYLWIVEGGTYGSVTEPFIEITYIDTGYFDIGLIVENPLGSDTLFIPNAIHVRGFPEIHYSLEIYDSIVIFNFLGPPGVEVEWWLEDSLIASSYIAEYVFDSNGIYGVTIKAFNECGFDSIHFNVHLFTVSTQGSSATGMFQLYPNPASDEIFVIMDREVPCRRISVLDHFGRRLRDFYFNEPADQFHLTGLEYLVPGIYIVEIRLDERRYYAKCVLR